LFFAESIDGGYTWTLASRTGHILQSLEASFGPRDKSYTLLGVEFADGQPQIWYPGNCGNIVIQLSTSAIDNMPRAVYQLAHECVHVLAPSGRSAAPVVEEGLATVFSEDYVLRHFGIHFGTELERYARAAHDVRELVSTYPDAIKALRKVEPAFYKLNVQTFEKAGLLNVPVALRDRLLTPFRNYMPA
jgi:hypothetical protein